MICAPTQAGFLAFLRTVVGIDPLNLPDSDPVIEMAFEISRERVSLDLAYAGSRHLYSMAVYNLAADRVINFADDQPDRLYFKKLRETLDINVFVPGVIASSGSGPTSEGTLNPEFMKNFTMGNLQNLKTQYGRIYLDLAQSVGTLWGLS